MNDARYRIFAWHFQSSSEFLLLCGRLVLLLIQDSIMTPHSCLPSNCDQDLSFSGIFMTYTLSFEQRENLSMNS